MLRQTPSDDLADFPWNSFHKSGIIIEFKGNFWYSLSFFILMFIFKIPAATGSCKGKTLLPFRVLHFRGSKGAPRNSPATLGSAFYSQLSEQRVTSFTLIPFQARM